MGASGRGRAGASQIEPNVYNRFQNAIMAQQEAAGARTEGMMGRDVYMNSAPFDQEVATAGQQRAGMLGGDTQNPSLTGRVNNAIVQNTAASNAGMLGDVEMMNRLRGEMEDAEGADGMEMGPGRSRRNVRRRQRG